MHIPLPTTSSTPVPPTPTWGAPWAPFSAIKPHSPSVKSRRSLCAGTLCPKWGQRRPKVPKRCPKGAQKLTFRNPKRHFWVPNWREWPLVKTSAGAMFSSHYEGPGPSLFAPKIDSRTHCAPGALFFTLLAPLWAPKWSPRSPPGSPKDPKGAPKPPQGRPETS